MRRTVPFLRRVAAHPWALLLSTVSLAGCGGGAPGTTTGSPVVKADSDAAKTALAENDRMIQERKAQEAKAWQRMRNAPPAPESNP